jgi:sec-independent protein translocase protein TatC
MAKHKQKQEQENEEAVMSLTGHLKELRNRILIVIAGLFAGLLICFNYAGPIVNLLTEQGTELGYQFVYLSPQALFMQYIKVALIGAVCLGSPVILYEIWAFIRPGLERKENFVFFFAMVAGLFFFVLGAGFAYKIALPFMLYFFIHVNASTSIIASISIESYLSFIMTIFITFGAVFEMPVVTVILTQLGLMRPEWMIKGRSVVIVVIFIVAAIITPPDVVSQIMIALPMLLLYQLSIWLCRIFRKRKIAGNEDEDEDEEETKASKQA